MEIKILYVIIIYISFEVMQSHRVADFEIDPINMSAPPPIPPKENEEK